MKVRELDNCGCSFRTVGEGGVTDIRLHPYWSDHNGSHYPGPIAFVYYENGSREMHFLLSGSWIVLGGQDRVEIGEDA